MTDLIEDVQFRALLAADLATVQRLHANAFGPGRFARTAYRVREGAASVSPHCRTAWRGNVLIGALTMTEIVIAEAGLATGGHWLLGPLAVRPDEVNRGYGRRLVAAALGSVAETGTPDATVILVGDLPYYGPFGFAEAPRGQIRMPGPVDPARLLIWRGPDGTRAVPGGSVRAAST